MFASGRKFNLLDWVPDLLILDETKLPLTDQKFKLYYWVEVRLYIPGKRIDNTNATLNR